MTFCSWPRCACKATGVYCSHKPATGKTRKRLSPISEKGKVKKEKKKELLQEDLAFYWRIWNERLHIDFETDLPIKGDFDIRYFHHVLEKRTKPHEHSDYTMYRHAAWNIVLVSVDTHNRAEANLDNTPKIKTYTERLIQMHDEGILQRIELTKHFI